MRLIGEGLQGPGGDGPNGLQIGIQRKSEVVDVVPGTAPRATFSLHVDIVANDDALDFRGPYVHGPRGDRFLYLSWGEVDQDGTFGMVQRMKIRLGVIDRALIERALEHRATLQGTLPLVDGAGRPLSGSVAPDRITWALVPDASVPGRG